MQVTVQKAKDLLIKGNNGTNNSFVTIAVGKEKYQTSIKEKEGKDVQWHEQCELLIPQIGNTASIILTVLHRNNLGLDEFLGHVNIPLASFDVYERPKSRWYKLQGKPGKEKGKDKYRGELEVRVGFTVKASTGSLMDLSKKEKFRASLGQLSNKVSGSLLSLNNKEKGTGIKQITRSISKKISKKKKDVEHIDKEISVGNKEDFSNNIDPGVISEDEDEFSFDNLSHKSSGTSINTNPPALENLAGGEFLRRSSLEPIKSPRSIVSSDKNEDEWTQKLFQKGDTMKRFSSGSIKFRGNEAATNVNTFLSNEKSALSKSSLSITSNSDEKETHDVQNAGKSLTSERKSLTSSFLEKQIFPDSDAKENTKQETNIITKAFPQLKKKEKKTMDRFVVGEEMAKVTEEGSKHSKEILRQFESKSRDDLIDMVIELQKDIGKSNHHLKELEDYLDQLLLKVMETTPRILQNPYISCKTQAAFNYH